MIISSWMTPLRGENYKDFALAAFDIICAHFLVTQDKREVFATLPGGFKKDGCVALGRRATYGTKDAVNLWGEIWAKQFGRRQH